MVYKMSSPSEILQSSADKINKRGLAHFTSKDETTMKTDDDAICINVIRAHLFRARFCVD
ncbi:hypothetical protein KIN20_028475 [Parelaphostrongylus tenuis]|uniref:Uncharacterized protein n=1 Tax=Parelaphostrongylus tenuis TaxID=148309 RepID=A0AAD5R1M9_PARTN|nr:hypothetical protein KIN20_028475 [Parelaphostrongylus tenuis]